MKERVAESIAIEAARILAENGGGDLTHAKQKAAKRLGVDNRKHWPDNLQVEAALRDYQMLFQSDRQPQALERLREKALEVMRALSEFNPRLAGSVLEGIADVHSAVEIHLFSDFCEEVIMQLMERRLHWQNEERTFRYTDGNKERRPLYRVQDGEIELELICFPAVELKNRSPLSPLDGRPARRVRDTELELLLSES